MKCTVKFRQRGVASVTCAVATKLPKVYAVETAFRTLDSHQMLEKRQKHT